MLKRQTKEEIKRKLRDALNDNKEKEMTKEEIQIKKAKEDFSECFDQVKEVFMTSLDNFVSQLLKYEEALRKIMGSHTLDAAKHLAEQALQE